MQLFTLQFLKLLYLLFKLRRPVQNHNKAAVYVLPVLHCPGFELVQTAVPEIDEFVCCFESNG